MLYNDLSPMENHHVSASLTVLRQEDNDFLSHLSRKVCGRLWKLEWGKMPACVLPPHPLSHMQSNLPADPGPYRSIFGQRPVYPVTQLRPPC